MTWRVSGVGKSYREAAGVAAHRAGLTLGAWLDRTILDHPAGPTRSDADAEIARALQALEDRIEKSGTRLGELIEPLAREVVRLDRETRALGDGEGTAALKRHLDRLDALERRARGETKALPPGRAMTIQVDGADRPRAGRHPQDGHGPGWTPVPQLAVLRRRRLMRIAGGIGAMMLIAGSAGTGLWLWFDHESALLREPPAMPGLLAQSRDQTPPLVIGALRAPDEAAQQPRSAASLAMMRERAHSLDPDAVFELAMALLRGDGVTRNPREATEWLATAAVAGHGMAQYELGRIYRDGGAGRRDPEQAFFWISAAAERGLTEAEHALGMLHAEGAGVERSPALAAQWFEKAAAANHAPAMYQLGLMHELGLDVRAAARRALEWYRKAAVAGSAAARDKVRALESAVAGGKTAVTQTAPAQPRTSAAVVPPASGPAAAPLSRLEIAELQGMLAALALDPGAADGVVSEKTRAAIRSLQRLAGLRVDGEPTRELLNEVRDMVRSQR